MYKSIIPKATYVIANSSSEPGGSNKLDCLIRAFVEWDNQNHNFMYGLERTTTKINEESQIDSHGTGNQAPQDKLHICWTNLPSLSTPTSSKDATSFGAEVLGELLDLLPAIYMRTNGACM